MSQVATKGARHQVLMCAFLRVDVKRALCIELPKEDPERKSEEKVGKLLKASCGSSDAPQAWATELGAA